MRRNPNPIGSIWLIIIMVVVLSGIVGVSIPVMSGGLPRKVGGAQNSATPAHTETFALRPGTPTVLAEVAGRSDEIVGQSTRSTPIVPTAAHVAPSTSTAVSSILAQSPTAAVPSAVSPTLVDTEQTAIPSPTSFVVKPTPTASSTAPVVQPGATTVPTRASSPAAVATLVSATRDASRVQPTPAKALPPAEALAVVAPELVSPPPDARLSNIALFEWRPAGPLENGQAYEVVVWSPEQDPNQAWGIAPPTSGTALEANLDVLVESGRFPQGSLYWTVLVVQQEPYTRLTSPTASPQRYLVYTVPESNSGPVFQLP